MATDERPSQQDERAVLLGVPRIGYDVHLCPFPGALYAWLQFMQERADYDYLMGVTGACFRRLYQRDDGGNVDLMYLSPEPHTRALRALGYAWREIPADAQALLGALRTAVAAGRPLIAFGIVGPPEAGLLTGYDEGGQVLIGWSYFQNMPATAGPLEREANGYYRLRGWALPAGCHAAFAALDIVGRASGPRADPRAVCLAALDWAVDLACAAERPGVPDHVSGLAAYDAWANGLESDADYPAGDAEVMATRLMVHADQCTMLVERRSAAAFVRQAADVLPEVAGPLESAAQEYERAAGEMPGIWLWGEDMGPHALHDLQKPATRRSIARRVRLARDAEARAVEQLQRALRKARR